MIMIPLAINYYFSKEKKSVEYILPKSYKFGYFPILVF